MTDHMFNPNHKYNLNNMQSEARKRAAREGRTTFIHNHKADTHCNEDCQKIEPENREG